MTITLTMDISKNTDNLRIIKDSMRPDIMSSPRSTITLTENRKDSIRITVKSADSVSERASVNTILRQLKLIEDTIEVIESTKNQK